VRIDKGVGVSSLLSRSSVSVAMYAGDDVTDLDGFRALRTLAEAGQLARALCVGVRSEEGPAAIEEQADLVVDGTSGMAEVLAALAAD
jgi:trehalose 6-phosphate phosphatase